MPKNPQGLNFRNVDDFLDFLPENEREIVEALREITLSQLPANTREKVSYNVPYYFLKKRVCFIWPAAVPWGMVPADGVKFGFCAAHKIADESGFIQMGGRKQVGITVFRSVKEVRDSELLLRSFLDEAVMVDG